MEPLMHVLIPLLFLLAIFSNLDKKYVFYLLPLTFLMDFDLFFFETHRFLFHNLLFVLIVSGIVYFAWDKKAYFVSLYYLCSHLILDLAEPGVAFFYPFVQKTFYLVFELRMTPEDWVFNFGFHSMPFSELIFGNAYWVSTWGVLICLLVVVLLIAKYWKN